MGETVCVTVYNCVCETVFVTVCVIECVLHVCYAQVGGLARSAPPSC